MTVIAEYLKLNRAASALSGIHLYQPYFQIVVQLNYTHSQLLQVLTQLYSDLLESGDLVQFDRTGLLSLKDGWICTYDGVLTLKNY